MRRKSTITRTREKKTDQNKKRLREGNVRRLLAEPKRERDVIACKDEMQSVQRSRIGETEERRRKERREETQVKYSRKR